MPRILRVDAPSGAQPHVFIAIPTYGPITAACVHALWASHIALNAAGIRATLEIMSGNCHIDDARNHLVRDFMETDCENFVFIDSDVGFDSVDLVKLIKYDVPVVAGVYPMKQEDEDYPVRTLPGELVQDELGLIEVQGVPTGFLKIQRYVLKELYAKAPKFKARSDGPDKMEIPIIFERTYKDEARFSGDYTFCEKWREMAGQIYVDPVMEFEHVGDHSWCGSLGAFWKKKHGVYRDQFGDWLNDLKEGKLIPQIFNELFMGWDNIYAATPELLEACYLMAKEKTGHILETGSGLTSLVMAVANPDVTIHCLEHNPFWATKTQDAIDKHGIKNIVMHFGALKDYGDYNWYSKFPEEEFSMVLCDGPPRALGSRQGLFDNIPLNGCPVLMDDCDDKAQMDIITEWSKNNNRKVDTLGEIRPFAVSMKE